MRSCARRCRDQSTVGTEDCDCPVTMMVRGTRSAYFPVLNETGVSDVPRLVSAPNESRSPVSGTVVDRRPRERIRTKIARGRRAKSDRLLARIGVLRSGNCGSRMVIGTSNSANYHVYRCQGKDCTRRMTILADTVERMVIERVEELRAGRSKSVRGECDAVELARLDVERSGGTGRRDHGVLGARGRTCGEQTAAGAA